MAYKNRSLTRHRKKILINFIECTKKIIDDEGIDAVTIRKVAKLSGLNSATIYNYFDNVDHLIIFSIMDELNNYIKDIPKYIKNCKNSMEEFYAIWDCFIKYSYNNPKPYTKLFFSRTKNEIEFYIEQYYKIFPLELNTEEYPQDVIDMLNSSEIFTRNIFIMQKCVDDGFLNQYDIYGINNIIIFTYEGILRRIDSNVLESEKAIEMFNHYIHRIIGSCNKQ